MAPRATCIVSFCAVWCMTSVADSCRACTCPGEEHPGPSVNVGRGAPEIDVLEVERNKTGAPGQVVSQSAQFAPFTHDYDMIMDTEDQFVIYSPDVTRQNGYKYVTPPLLSSYVTDRLTLRSTEGPQCKLLRLIITLSWISSLPVNKPCRALRISPMT